MGLYSILKSQIQSTFFAHVPCLLLRHLHTSIPAYISFHTSTSVPCLPATPSAHQSTSLHQLSYQHFCTLLHSQKSNPVHIFCSRPVSSATPSAHQHTSLISFHTSTSVP